MRMFLLACAGSLTSGCAIIPFTENAAGVNSQQISEKIKCETRTALKRIVLDVIRDPRSDGAKSNASAANDIEKDDSILKNKNYFRRLSRDTRAALEKYDGAAIGFDFTFTMTENNSLQGNLNLLSTLGRGTDGLNFGASNTRERKNIENFRITKILSDFFQPNLRCDNYHGASNYIYPISGEIGIYEILKRFFDLNEGGDLGISSTDKTSLYAVTVTFTTSFTGSVNPKITIIPIGKAYGIPDAGITAAATRSDIHTVIIALSLPPDRTVNFVGPGGVPLGPLQGRSLARANVDAQLTYQIDKNRPLLFFRPGVFDGGLFQ
ncbi:hypothetical protein ABS772_16445 [Methylorubrum podarium]|uniref:Lipoprotein n=1 Tax=Methylorubrum podarium TaxID=200476 RepID=A0ABV1QQ13_9HYPH